MNKYRVMIGGRLYHGYHRTHANAIFGALRADEFDGNQGAFVTVACELIETRIPRTTTGTRRVK